MQIKVESSINRLVNLQIATGIANSLTNAIKEPLAVVAMIMVMLFQIIVLEQSLTPILVSIVLFYRALNALLTSQLQLQKMLGEVGSLEMVEQEFTFLKNNHQIQGKNSINSFSRDISFENIDFSYTEDSKKVFSEVNLQIKSRSTVAFVGESGSGKTTLADLISLMLEPSSGRLVIDNIPSQSIQLDSWRSQIGYVSQDTIVFDDSIANNISLWGDQFDSKSDILSEIKIAAKKAHLHDFIVSLPSGYETLVGERGVKLSGGQRQRLFIARELFRRPNVMILDEATSALDSESERAIQASIDEMKERLL